MACGHIDQMALAMAAAARTETGLRLIGEEVASPSLFFKKLAVKQFIAQSGKSDAQVIEFIRTSVPAVRLKMLHGCVRGHRTAVLDAVVDELMVSESREYIGVWLHGCGRPTVARLLKQNPQLLECPTVNIDKLCRFHAPTIVALIRADLEAADATQRQYWEKPGIT
jgi:hypothetical protein